MKIPFTDIHYKPKTFVSYQDRHFGDSVPKWLNRNQFSIRQDGGVTGFFKNLTSIRGHFYREIGPEFHGIIKGDIIESTERR